MIPEIILCAMLIDQFDQQMGAKNTQVIAAENIVDTYVDDVDDIYIDIELTEDKNNTYIIQETQDFIENPDKDIVEGTDDNQYAHVLLSCGHGRAWDCVDDHGDYYECAECGYIEYYNEIPENHECVFEVINDGEIICEECIICGNGHIVSVLEDIDIKEE